LPVETKIASSASGWDKEAPVARFDVKVNGSIHSVDADAEATAPYAATCGSARSSRITTGRACPRPFAAGFRSASQQAALRFM
jgi:hypothetical protein